MESSRYAHRPPSSLSRFLSLTPNPHHPATATYRLLPTILLSPTNPVPPHLATKFASCFSPGVIRVHPVTKAVSVDTEKLREESVSREVFRHAEFEGMVKLGRVRDWFICPCPPPMHSFLSFLLITLSLSLSHSQHRVRIRLRARAAPPRRDPRHAVKDQNSENRSRAARARRRWHARRRYRRSIRSEERRPSPREHRRARKRGRRGRGHDGLVKDTVAVVGRSPDTFVK